MKNSFLVLSSVITIAAVLPYLLGILKGKTKPNVVSWITWTLLAGVATLAELSGHEYRTAIFTTTIFLETLSVVILGLFHGYVKYTRFDYACQISALTGLLLWWVFNSTAVAVVAAVTIDFVGALPTFRHAWKQPGEENWPTYLLCAIGGALAAFALTSINWTSLTYPVYVAGVNILITIAIIIGGVYHPNYKSSETSKIKLGVK